MVNPGAKPKKARPLCEASSYSKSYSTSARYFSRQIANDYSFLLHSNCIPDLTPVIFLVSPAFSDLSHSSAVTASLVAIVTHTQLFLSQTFILMCNSSLSSWNRELEKFNSKKFLVKKFHRMPATTKNFTTNYFHMNIFNNEFFPNYSTYIKGMTRFIE